MDIFKYIVDIVYILTAITVVVVFTARGFVASVFRFGRYIVAAMLSYSFGPILSGFLYQKWIFNFISAPVSETVGNFLANTVGSLDIDTLIASLPALVQKFIDADAMKAKYGASVENFDRVADDFATSVSSPLATLISNIVSYVVIFFLAILVLSLLFNILKHVFELPGLNIINRILGMILGGLTAFLMLAGITWLLGVLISLFGGSGKLAELTASSRIFGYFNNLEIFNLFK